ncbi:M23 family metallopeptidase [Microbacterium sp. zg.Y1090]|uniref:M23 family metallopeptidase n=1 Tax=Microbacterium wangruii TaxID=3049073 RepID=UPI00214D8218|nr:MULTISPECIES: M23 family metallopeptidase [unclassified Microbacterium]MCR2819904.1 M23 family metallopeptidase [Microbacterium sp. zg.Y1090]WIM27492.1 M23 family metallopeptidase [Microbacterium sp. zg-Y1090]
MPSPLALALPFTGRWLVQNSPARRVPSHGVDVLGQRYAIDFVAVDARGRTSATRDWRTALATEPPERFVGFGMPILAPAAGTVVATHDGEPDHEARRSQPALLAYAMGQAGRLRAGVAAVAGNHVIVRDDASGMFVAVVHLRRGSVRVEVGEMVAVGEQMAQCGNSGNSTEPHVHVQAMDSADLRVARGVPIAFTAYRQWGRDGLRDVGLGIPDETAIVAPLPASDP